MYVVRNATLEDVQSILPYTTETGKVDMNSIRQSDEVKVFIYNDRPLMILGLAHYPTGTDDTLVAVWGLFNREVEKHTRRVVQTCKDLIFDRVGYTFVVLIDESVDKYSRFAKFFGFIRTKDVEEIGGKLYRYYVKRN